MAPVETPVTATSPAPVELNPPTPVNADGVPTKRGDSAASMATEILSAAPRTPVPDPTENAPTMLAEDVTIMAKGRRRRFRLR
jgi:hypothetical protein